MAGTYELSNTFTHLLHMEEIQCPVSPITALPDDPVTAIADSSSELATTCSSQSTDETSLSEENEEEGKEALLPENKTEDIALTRKLSSDPEFENAFFKIDKSDVAGWGAFATRDLVKGDVILREIPLFVATNNDLFEEFYSLGSDDMNIALSLHSHQCIKEDTPSILGIWHTNCFAVGGHTAGLFPIAARFNHACYPINNVEYRVDPANNLIMTAREDIVAGQELTISYGKNLSPQLLYLCYGFRCKCGYCSGLGDEEMAIFTSQW